MPTHLTITNRSARLSLVAGLVLLLAACSSIAPGTPTGATPTGSPAASSAAASASASASAAATGDVTVTITGFEFTADAADTSGDVPTLTIPVGTSVSFVNEDSTRHTATNGTDGEADADAAFDFNLGQQGAAGTYTFDTAGEFGVTCKIHSGMNMTIIVE
ncbi:MAG: plastocyanin/azurin family copper-binding protein [Chloroflexota bacterium]